MLLATWNVNGLRARFDYMTHWLRERQPDVVGLQELKMTDEAFPAADFEALGYHVLTHGQKAWNGVAILSREPGEAVQRGLPGQEAFGSRLITADVAGIRFTTVYCPNGKSVEHADYAAKLAWFDALVEHLAPAAGATQPAIVCGDFNICPGPLDSWDEAGHEGAIFHTDAERERMSGLYEQGWSDLYRAAHPDTQAFSWWDYRAGSFQRNRGLRIDFVLANAAAQAMAGEIRIDRDFRKKVEGLTASDHAPVLAELR